MSKEYITSAVASGASYQILDKVANERISALSRSLANTITKTNANFSEFETAIESKQDALTQDQLDRLDNAITALPDNIVTSSDAQSEAKPWVLSAGQWVNATSLVSMYKTSNPANIKPVTQVLYNYHTNDENRYNYIEVTDSSNKVWSAHTLINPLTASIKFDANGSITGTCTSGVWTLSAKDFTETFTAVSANTAYFTGNGTTDSALSLSDDVTAKLSKVPDATPFELSAGNYIKITPDTTNNIVTIAVDGTIDTFTGISANTAYFTGNGKDDVLSVNTAWSNSLATSAGVTGTSNLWALTTTGWTAFTAGGEKGDPGFSPTVTITDITGTTPSGVNVEFTYQNDQGVIDTTAYSLYAGEKGEKGFSPTVATTPITAEDNTKTGTEITFTYLDEAGTTTTAAYSAWNGKDGEGAPPSFSASDTITEWNGADNTFSYIKMKIENSDDHDSWGSDNTLHFVLQQS